MHKLHVAVLMGGPSSEYAVSLKTGAKVARAFPNDRFRVTPVVISKKKIWIFPSGRSHERYLSTPDALQELRRRRVDVAFIAMHGEFGEDGQIQLLLESASIPHTGSGVPASALAMDKVRAAQVFRRFGIPVPAFVAFSREDWRTGRDAVIRRIKERVRFPWVVKPVNLGSSVGVGVVREWGALDRVVRGALAAGDRAMAQEFVAGCEATCAVLDVGKGKDPVAFPVIYIIPNGGTFYDYRSKYATRGSDHIIPAPFAPEVNEKIQELALAAHQYLGCRGLTRTDVIVSPEQGIMVLETNTVPGMTETSLAPQAAGAVGISFRELVEKLALAALR